jgi:NAD(P)H-nitrite reductase large subunit
MRTSVKNIYAAGDVTEAAGFHTGEPNSMPSSPMPPTRRASPRTTWPAARRFRRQPGDQRARHAGPDLDLLRPVAGRRKGGEGVELVDEAHYRYLSLQFKDDILIGATSIGWTDHVGALRGLVQTQAPLGEWKERLLADPTCSSWRPTWYRDKGGMRITFKLFAVAGLPAGGGQEDQCAEPRNHR